MTPPDWASQRVEKVSSDGFSGDAWAVSADECARLLRLEHARAVKVVKAAQRYGPNFRGGMVKCRDGEWISVKDLLTALQRGRTQKGTR